MRPSLQSLITLGKGQTVQLHDNRITEGVIAHALMGEMVLPNDYTMYAKMSKAEHVTRKHFAYGVYNCYPSLCWLYVYFMWYN